MSRIYERNGSWAYIAELGLDPITGKRIRRSKGGFKKQKDATEALTKIMAEYYSGELHVESELKLSDFIEEWLKLYEATGKVKISTVRVRKHETNRLKSHFGIAKLREITHKMYQNFLFSESKDLAFNTLTGVHRTARMLFRKAIELKYIKEDPTDYAVVPKKRKTVEELENESPVPKYYEKDELKVLLNAAKEYDPQFHAIMFVLAYTGMRAGELCGLKWKDIDFKDGNISIYRTLYNPSSNALKYTLLTPKTKTARRTIKIDKDVLKVLKKHRVEQKKCKLKCEKWHDKDFVFSSILHPGYPYLIKTIEMAMDRVIKRTNLKRITPHGLRHTHASLLAQAGVGLQEIMDRLGHSDDQTTKNIYLHVTETKKEEAAQKFSKLMND